MWGGKILRKFLQNSEKFLQNSRKFVPGFCCLSAPPKETLSKISNSEFDPVDDPIPDLQKKLDLANSRIEELEKNGLIHTEEKKCFYVRKQKVFSVRSDLNWIVEIFRKIVEKFDRIFWKFLENSKQILQHSHSESVSRNVFFKFWSKNDKNSYFVTHERILKTKMLNGDIWENKLRHVVLF